MTLNFARAGGRYGCNLYSFYFYRNELWNAIPLDSGAGGISVLRSDTGGYLTLSPKANNQQPQLTASETCWRSSQCTWQLAQL